MAIKIILFVLLVGVTIVTCQDGVCSDDNTGDEKPGTGLTSEALKTLEWKGDIARYNENEVNKTIAADATAQKSIEELTIVLANQTIPVLAPKNVCKAKYALYKMSIFQTVDKHNCFVIRPWWFIQWYQVISCSGPCDLGYKQLIHERPYYGCRPTNRVGHNYYLYCPTHPSRKLHRRTLWLTKCCNCHKYSCYHK